MKILFVFLICHFSMIPIQAQDTISLYDLDIPNSRPVPNKEISEISPDNHILLISKVTRPTLTVFLPQKQLATGAAVVICPGGGYTNVAAGHEGYDVARKLNEAGVAAFVLKYRIPDDSTMVRKEIGPLQDAQRAIQLVRQRAAEWKVDPHRVGILGFSAGGHLASTAGTHFSKSLIPNPGNISLRPDFMVLVYPVISFEDSIAHIGSRNQLIGKNPSPEKILEYSNEWQVSKATPPTFLIHARDDEAVPVQNSLVFYKALQEHGVPSSDIYLYEKGGHGFGLNDPDSPVRWMDLVIQWMRKNLWLNH